MPKLGLRFPTFGEVVTAVLLTVPLKLIENAWTGWIDDRIAEHFWITSPGVADVLYLLERWAFPFALAVLILWTYHRITLREKAGTTLLSGRGQMIIGLFLIAGGCVIGIVGLSMIASGSKPAVQPPANPLVKNVSGPPIEWRFDKPATILLYSRNVGDALRIGAIQVNATNRSDLALKNVSARIVADLKNAPLNMRVNPHGLILAPEDSATLIPPRRDFDLLVEVAPQGLSAEDFLNQYGALKFIFDYEQDGARATFTEIFSLSYIEDQIAFIEERTRSEKPAKAVTQPIVHSEEREPPQRNPYRDLSDPDRRRLNRARAWVTLAGLVRGELAKIQSPEFVQSIWIRRPDYMQLPKAEQDRLWAENTDRMTKELWAWQTRMDRMYGDRVAIALNEIAELGIPLPDMVTAMGSKNQHYYMGAADLLAVEGKRIIKEIASEE